MVLSCRLLREKLEGRCSEARLNTREYPNMVNKTEQVSRERAVPHPKTAGMRRGQYPWKMGGNPGEMEPINACAISK